MPSNWTGVKILTHNQCTADMQGESFLKYTVSPNPANNTIHIEGHSSGKSVSAHIYNSMGQLVHSALINSQSNVNVSHLQSGIYYLRIETAGSVETHQIIVSH